MGYLILEMVVGCGEGLKEFNLSSSNMNVYVIAILKGASLKEQNAQTNLVKGGQNPSWNFPMKFFIDRSEQIQALNSYLTFTFVSKNIHDEYKSVGQIHVTILDLLRATPHGNYSMQSVSYPIKKIPGHTIDGKFNFTFRFIEPQSHPLQSPLPSRSPAPQFQAQGTRGGGSNYGRLKEMVTKVVMGLGVSVGGGYISRALFDNNANYSFYDNEATPFPFSFDPSSVIDGFFSSFS